MTTYFTPPLNNAGVGNNDYGERWGDALGNIQQLKRVGFTEEAYRDTSHDLLFAKHNADATMVGEIQFDHDYILDTEVRLHVHMIPMANAAGNVYVEYAYVWAVANQAVPAAAGWTTGNATIALLAADQYKHKVGTLFVTTPVTATASSILLFDITRASTNVLDTYDTNKDHGTVAANLAYLYADVHYRKGSPGTATEWA